MQWIFWAFVGAAVIHVVEEFWYPGGFLEAVKGLNPRIASLVTLKAAIIINGLFLLLCVTGAVVGRRSIVLGLSIASLLFFNALTPVNNAKPAL